MNAKMYDYYTASKKGRPSVQYEMGCERSKKRKLQKIAQTLPFDGIVELAKSTLKKEGNNGITSLYYKYIHVRWMSLFILI